MGSVGVCGVMCRSLLHASRRQHTVWIEIVWSHGSACQLLHRICIIQQPRGRREQGAREDTRPGEELWWRQSTDWELLIIIFIYSEESYVMLTILQGSALDYHFVVAALLSAPSCPGWYSLFLFCSNLMIGTFIFKILLWDFLVCVCTCRSFESVSFLLTLAKITDVYHP